MSCTSPGLYRSQNLDSLLSDPAPPPGLSATHGEEIFIMIIGGLDVCDAFKFHRDEDTEFLGHPVVSMVSMVGSSQQWSAVVRRMGGGLTTIAGARRRRVVDYVQMESKSGN